MLNRVVANFSSELDLDAEQIADLLWLMTIVQPSTTNEVSRVSDVTSNQTGQNQAGTTNQRASQADNLKEQEARKSSQTQQITEEGAPVRPQGASKPGGSKSLADRARRPIKIPDSTSLRSSLNLSKALRPLIRLVPTGAVRGLDEAATVNRIAEEDIWIPVTQPELEPWLDAVIVVDEHRSMQVWQKTVQELRELLAGYGAFRDVQLYGLRWQPPVASEPESQTESSEGSFYLRSNWGVDAPASEQLRPECLIDPNQRRVILLVSDCVAPYWWQGQIFGMLQKWSVRGMVALVQMLPEWLWDRTALREADRVMLRAIDPGVVNQQLLAEANPFSQVVMPVLALEPDWVLAWSRMIAGIGDEGLLGRLLPQVNDLERDDRFTQLSAQQRLDFFRLGASDLAQELMGLLAATPVITLPVIRMVQAAMLPKSDQVQMAEVLLGGLLRPKPGQDGSIEQWVYEFVDPEIPKELLKGVPVSSTVRVLSRYIEKQFDLSLRDFVAELMSELSENEDLQTLKPFAIVSANVLRRKGREYEGFIQTVDQYYPEVMVTTNQTILSELQEFKFEIAEYIEETDASEAEPQIYIFDIRINFLANRARISREPRLQTFEFDVLTLQKNEEDTTPDLLAELNWQRVSFMVATLNEQGRIQTRQAAAWKYVEGIGVKPFRSSVGLEILLEMVAIPGGEFQMGSNESQDEQPIHVVKVQPFFMSQYPVTQDQWEFVAKLPQINRSLESNPSRYKGDSRPVERVSWDDAIEFCARLSKHKGREYRLPTEAEWEYSCRAGTTAKYHFGDEITKELANYSGKETTIVGQFPYANAFGLYDMHGNVWEWCMDHWHENYEKAPTDGSAWLDKGASKNASRVLRGGSWNTYPGNCRSASRGRSRADGRYNVLGFRLLSPARILP
jgi:formylglycine-generating enzyme required for sulfatase activity